MFSVVFVCLSVHRGVPYPMMQRDSQGGGLPLLPAGRIRWEGGPPGRTGQEGVPPPPPPSNQGYTEFPGYIDYPQPRLSMGPYYPPPSQG